MNYEDFSRHYDAAMREARQRFGAAAQGQTVICNGMDKDCETLILSDGYVEADADRIAAAAVEAIESDFPGGAPA